MTNSVLASVRRRRVPIRCAASLAGLAVALAAVPAQAQTWAGQANDDWDNSFNWPDGGRPSGSRQVIIDRDDPFAPVVSEPGTTIGDQQITVGIGGTARLSVTSTGVLSNGSALIAQNAGSQGTVTVDGGRWTNGGTLLVGLNGTAALNILAGGDVMAASIGIAEGIEGNAASSGTIIVRGAGSSLTSNGLFGIGNGNTGTLRIDQGATASAGETRIGLGGSGGFGTVVVDGAGSSLELGALGMGTGGRAFLTVSGGAALRTTSAFIDRTADSAERGLFTVTGPGTRWTATGTVVVGGLVSGELRIADGAVVSGAAARIGNNEGSMGRVSVDAAQWTGSGALEIGLLGSGDLQVRNGGTVAMQRISIGTTSNAPADAIGTASVAGAGASLTATGDLRIGDNGVGALEVRNGATVRGGSLFVAFAQGTTGDGSVVIDGAGSSVEAGAFGTGVGGKAFVTVSNGGRLSTGSAIIDRLGDDDSSGLLTVTGAGSRWTVDGLTAIGGIANGAMLISDGGVVESRQGATVGNDDGAFGAVTVRGAGSVWRIREDDPEEDFLVFLGGSGSADVRIEEGGLIDSNGAIFVANETGEASSITLDGAGSRLVSDGVMQIGSRGDGSVTVGNGAQLVTNGATTGSTQLGSSSTVTVTDGGNWTTGARVDLGVRGDGHLSISDGGTVDIGGFFSFSSSTASDESSLVVDGAGSRLSLGTEASLGFGGSASITISGGAQLVSADLTPVPGNPFSKGLWIGEGGAVPEGGGARQRSRVDMTVTGEDTRVAIAGYVRVGESGGLVNLTIADGAWFSTETNFKIAPGLSGDAETQTLTPTEAYVTVTDAGSRLSADFLSVGDPAGKGRLSIVNGAEVLSNSSTIGNGSGRAGGIEGTLFSDGAVLVSGEGSRWINSSDGAGPVSGAIGTAQGTGLLQIEKGGRVETRLLQLGNWGTGAVFGQAHGTLIIGAVEGDAPVATGTLVSADGISFAQGDDVSSTLIFNHTNDNYVFDARMYADAAMSTASQGLIRHLAGTTRLTADSSAYTGVTELVGGRLIVDGALGGRILVGAGGFLGGNGRIGTTVFGNGATLSPGEGAIGTMRFNGLELSAGSIFEVQVNDQGCSDRVEVAGGPVVLGGATLRVRDAAGGAFNGRNPYVYTIIDNEGTQAVSGTFGTVTNELAFLAPSVSYAGGTGNDVVLTLTPVNLFPDVAATPNQFVIAEALEALDTSSPDAASVYQSILFMTEPEAQRLFSLASGEAHASMQIALTETGGLYTRSLERRAAFAPSAGGRGMALWIGPLAHDMRLRGDGNAAQLNADGLGLAGGIDLVAHETGEDGSVFLGLSAGYLEGDADVFQRLSRADTKSTMIGAYGAFRSGPFRLSAALSAGWHKLSMRRGIVAGDIDRTAVSRRDGKTLGFAATAQYDVPMGSTRLSPFVTLRVDKVDLDSAIETGAGALNLAVADAKFTDSRIGAGIELGHSSGNLSFGGRLAYEKAIGNRYADQVVRLEGSDTLLGVVGPYSRTDGVVAGVDATVALGKAVSLGVSYDGRFGEGLRRHRGMASLTIGF